MSNKKEIAAITTAAEGCTLLPKLRFPEFQGKKGWESKSLIDVCLRITNGKANAEDHEENGIYPLYDRSEVIKRSSKFAYDDEAIIIPGEGVRFQPKYYKGKFNLHQRAYALMQHQCDARFVYYSMDRFQSILAKKAVKSTVLSLRLPILEQFRLPITNKAEQQKIADCLGSIDERIALESQKLDTLKLHKKGLMQQLFPRKGETVPRLRFPELKESWGFINIGDFFDLTDKAEKTTAFDKEKVLTVKLHAAGVVKSERATLTGAANYFNRKAGQFIFSKIDLLNGAFGVIPNSLDGFASSSDVPAYSFNAKHSPSFFIHWLKAKYEFLEIERTGTSSTLKRVSPEKFLSLAILVPTFAEQQKIADCLTSLDDRITSQTQKIESLKTHKKGLMQQLFPTMGEM